jgi:hypothetical protein
VSDYRKILATPCWDCVIDVVGWRDSKDPSWPELGWVNIGLISNHHFAENMSWRAKLRRIRSVLRGESCSFLEFFRREDLDEFTKALQDAADVVLPTKPI